MPGSIQIAVSFGFQKLLRCLIEDWLDVMKGRRQKGGGEGCPIDQRTHWAVTNKQGSVEELVEGTFPFALITVLFAQKTRWHLHNLRQKPCLSLCPYQYCLSWSPNYDLFSTSPTCFPVTYSKTARPEYTKFSLRFACFHAILTFKGWKNPIVPLFLTLKHYLTGLSIDNSF